MAPNLASNKHLTCERCGSEQMNLEAMRDGKRSPRFIGWFIEDFDTPI